MHTFSVKQRHTILVLLLLVGGMVLQGCAVVADARSAWESTVALQEKRDKRNANAIGILDNGRQ